MLSHISICGCCVASLIVVGATRAGAGAAEPVFIGNRLEPFADDYLIDSLSGGAELRLHPPVAREVAIAHEEPWEGNSCAYHTVFQDGEIYRMYYRGGHSPADPGNLGRIAEPPSFTCYAESADGIHWIKPKLGLYEFDGAKDNNIVLIDKLATHNFAPFKDANPSAKPNEKYKAVAGYRAGGLYAYKSSDGIHWEKLQVDLAITGDSLFDSLNVAFFDAHRKCYVAYFRDLRNGKRDIKTCTSDDFVHWTPSKWLEYPGAPAQHLYTNAIQPYARAPHILVGLPKRFIPNRNPSGHRAGGVSDALLMTSRDGLTFYRWSEAIVRPGLQKSRWVNRNNMPAWGIVETKSNLPGAPNEMSIYTTEDYYEGNAAKLRRHTWRLDGFASLYAPFRGGEVVTKPVVFGGKNGGPSGASADRNGETNLLLNLSTSAAGSARVELQDESGKPVPGYSLADCDEIFADSIELPVNWNGNADVSRLASKPLRVRFQLKDADVFAMQFRLK